MTNLITIENQTPVVSLDTIANFSGIDTKSTKSLIRTYKSKLEDLVGTEFEEISGRSEIDWNKVRLNEDAASFLLTLMKNSDTVVEFKFALIKQFKNMRNELTEMKEQALMATFKEETLLAVEAAVKMNTYDGGMISVGKYCKEIDGEVNRTIVWAALERMGWSKTVVVPTQFRRIGDNVPEYVGVASSEFSTPVFTEAAIRSAVNSYGEALLDSKPAVNIAS